MLTTKPYYAPQNDWSSNDYYSLHRYLHRLVTHADRKKDEIEQLDVQRMSDKTKVLLYCINNDSYNLPEVTDIIGRLEWITDNSYSNIELYIANIQSLLLLKVRAVHFAG